LIQACLHLSLIRPRTKGKEKRQGRGEAQQARPCGGLARVRPNAVFLLPHHVWPTACPTHAARQSKQAPTPHSSSTTDTTQQLGPSHSVVSSPLPPLYFSISVQDPTQQASFSSSQAQSSHKHNLESLFPPSPT